MVSPKLLKPVYTPVSREAFDKAARTAALPRRERELVYTWVKRVEATGYIWPSALYAVHTWIRRKLAHRLAGRSGT